jgi:hypothetical protein
MRCLPTFVRVTRSGAGKPLQQILVSHADGLARHERAHLKQIERINKTLQGAP